MNVRKTLVWLGAAALVVLFARAVAYAVEPSPIAQLLAHQAGGPSLPVLAVASLGIGAVLAAAIAWLAALGVAEQALLETRTLAAPPPRLSVAMTLLRAIALWSVTSFAGGLLEAYIHWRAGLGWHGLHCLVGPVHRDLIPIHGALSLVAAALIAAGEHVLAWLRRTFARLRGAVRPAAVEVEPRIPTGSALPRCALCLATAGARGPP